MADTLTQIRVGPDDDGRRMAFADFQRAEPVNGRRYELARGVVEVTDIPGRLHFLVLDAIEARLNAYRVQHPERIRGLGGAGRTKLELPGMESERHPDLAIYSTPIPDDEYPWDKWIPAVVVEVVSPGDEARTRDYVTKREEYLAAGILEYWIVDPQNHVVLALVRHGDVWREKRLGATDKLVSALFPGFELDLAAVFGAPTA